jgi:subtilisin family serine protease
MTATPDSAPRSADRDVQVMVELTDSPSVGTYAVAYDRARQEAAALEVNRNRPPALTAANDRPAIRVSDADMVAYETATSTLDAKQQAMLPTLTGPGIGGTVIYRVQRAYNGIALVVAKSKLSEIATLPGVKAVHALIPKTVNAFSDIDFLGTRGTGGAWNKVYPSGVGLHGENLKICVIDTGVDYVHTNFGGPGTTAAYNTVGAGTTAPNPYFPSAKIPNGTDLCGNTYNASGTGPALVPQPDPDPFDGVNGHGTGTASLATGLGVNANGTTYIGNYDDNTPIAAMKISPGFAPAAKLYPVRIIGAGSTNLVTQAVDWATNPANFGGTLPDVISMSIGGTDGRFDDPEEIAWTNAATAGILCTLSAGNNGNTYDIQGGPSAANKILAVAASFNDQGGFIYDATVTGNQPAAIAGKTAFAVRPTLAPAINSPVTGDVVYAIPADGGPATTPVTTSPYSNAAQMSGKICLVDRGGGVTFEQKAKRAEASGAIAVIIVNIPPNNIDTPPQNVTLGYTSAIPVVGISQRDGDNLKAAANFSPTTGVSQSSPAANVTIAAASGTVTLAGTQADTITSYSSRGPRLIDSYLKPDITAPAELTLIARTLTGSGFGLFNGTSSAAPHVGGIMVLLKQLHPTWTVDELLALVSNTANHDTWTGPNTGDGGKQGVSRTGAGRVDVKAACASDVIVYNSSDVNQVNLSYGVVDCLADGVAESTRVTKNITVKNKGTSPVTYNISYQEITPASDAGFQTTAPLNFTVAAGASVNIPITFAASGHLMKHSRDATVPILQFQSATGQQFRSWLTEKAGYAVFTPTNSALPTLRLALHATPRAAGAMHAANLNPVPTADVGTMNVQLSGLAVNTGNNLTQTTASPGQPGQDVKGLVKTFDLQYAGTNNSSPLAIKYVGVTSDYSSRTAGAGKLGTQLAFMTETVGDASHPWFSSGYRDVIIDANMDGSDDFIIETNARTDPNTNGGSRTNIYQTALFPLHGGSGAFNAFTNGFSSGSADTNIFNNSIEVYYVAASSLGYNGGPTRFKYRVATYDINDNLIDITPYLFYDIANPGFEANGGNLEPYYYFDLPGNLAVNYSGANIRNFSTSTIGLALAHMHNASGQRVDAVKFPAPAISDFNPKSGPVGTNVIISGNNFGPNAQVFFNGVQATNVLVFGPGQIQAQVPAGATDGPITVRTAGGTATSAVPFDVTP